MPYRLGYQAKLFYGAAGETAATALNTVQNVTLSLEVGEADITTRACNSWKCFASTLKEASINFGLLWDTEDAGFAAIKTAYFSGTPISLFISDGAGSGLDADFVITSFSRDEQLTEALTVSVTCKPTIVSRAPAWRDSVSG